MLSKLSVSNYALISALDLDLETGFTVITGETGAGKSIILGAIRLVLGERADTKVLFDQARKCIVEATFRIKAYKLKSAFNKHDLDYWDDTIIRREILPSGKSRAFINDTPVTLNVLKEIADQLVDLHSQHETQLFKTKSFQFDLLDAYAGASADRDAYGLQYSQYRKLEKEIDILRLEEEKSRLDQDYFNFQLIELEEAQLKSDELVSLEQDLKLLQKSEDINRIVSYGEDVLGSSGGVLELLDKYLKELSALTDLGDPYQTWYKQIQSAQLELEDVSLEMGRSSGEVSAESNDLAHITSRVNQINGLMQKHRLNSEQDLINLQTELSEKLSKIGSIEVLIGEKEAQLDAFKTSLTKQANKLHDARFKAAKNLQNEVEEILSNLAMKDAKFKVGLDKNDGLDNFGLTGLKIFFQSNMGSREEELHKVASGGELSRVVLTLKSILCKRKQLPTVIFDEIDTGVSGEIAGKMGKIMRSMSASMQLLSITHLPQVAGQGEHHFTVFKTNEDSRTISYIKPLKGDERVTEIAKMLSGEKVELSALETAKSLIGSNN